MTALLEVRDLQVSFSSRGGWVRALDGVHLSIQPGEILGVVGESGAGKSLTGMAVLGLLEGSGRITGGEIYFDGHRIDQLAPEALRRLRGSQIGAIFQDPLSSLNPLHTIGHQLTETIQEHLQLSHHQARARAVELLEATGIASAQERLGHYPHQFSGGMRQRVVIALALCANPRLVIADEPTTALDVSVQAQIIKLLKKLCREHQTSVMLITHDMGVIAETCDQVAVMYAGRVAEKGAIAQILQSPRHPYTAALMAAIPAMEGEAQWLEQIDGAMPRSGQVPAGCAFHPRCKFAQQRCHSDKPSASEAVACFFPLSA